jgi:hypothetical protein
MWLPGAGVGGEDLTAKGSKGAKKRVLTTKVTKFKRIISEPFVSFAPSW